MYEEVGYKIIDNYENLSDGFHEIVNGNLKLSKLGVKDNIAKKLELVVNEKMKTPTVIVGGILKLSTTETNGIEIIKKILNNLISKKIEVTYLGAPKYKISLEEKDYKAAETKLKEAIDSTLQLGKKLKADIEFNRKNA